MRNQDHEVKLPHDTLNHESLNPSDRIDLQPIRYSELIAAREFAAMQENDWLATQALWEQEPDEHDPKFASTMAMHFKILKQLVSKTAMLDKDQQILVDAMVGEVASQPGRISNGVAALRLLPLATYINSIS